MVSLRDPGRIDPSGQAAGEGSDAWTTRVREAKKIVESSRGDGAQDKASEPAVGGDLALGRENLERS
jgi:hypothetical protein